MWLLVFSILLAISFIGGLKRRKVKKAATTPTLIGDGSYGVKIVDDNDYLGNFIELVAPRAANQLTVVELPMQARLTLEDSNKFDMQAVRVSIKGHTVEYLPRAIAGEFRRAVTAIGLIETFNYDCAAIVRVGENETRSDQGRYGVWLDLTLNR